MAREDGGGREEHTRSRAFEFISPAARNTTIRIALGALRTDTGSTAYRPGVCAKLPSTSDRGLGTAFATRPVAVGARGAAFGRYATGALYLGALVAVLPRTGKLF